MACVHTLEMWDDYKRLKEYEEAAQKLQGGLQFKIRDLEGVIFGFEKLCRENEIDFSLVQGVFYKPNKEEDLSTDPLPSRDD